MANKAARHSKTDIAPMSSPFAEFLSGLQTGKVPQSDQLATSIADIQGKLAEWKPTGANDPFGFLFDQLNSVLEGIKGLAEKNLDENLNKILEQGSLLVKQGKEKAAAVGSAAGGDAKAIKDDASDVVASIRSLSTQLIYSSEFRTFLLDCVDLLRDAGGVAVDKAKEAALAGVDAAADAAKEAAAEALSAESEETKGKKRSREASTRKATKKARDLTTLTGEDRKRIRAKFDSIVQRANANEPLRNGLDAIISISKHLRHAAAKGKRKAGSAVSDFDLTPLKTAWEETKKLFDKFGLSANSIEEFSSDMWSFFSEVANSKNFSEAFSEIGTFLSDAVKNPASLTDVAFSGKFEALTDKLRSAWGELKDKGTDTFSRAYDILSKFVTDFAKAPAMAIASKAQSLVSSALFDDKGRFVMGGDMMAKVRDMFLKLFVAQLKALPLPKLEGSNDTYDWCFEDMSLNLADFMPDQLHVTVKNDMDIDVNNASATEVRGKLVLTAANIKPSLTNVKFWFRRRGLISLEDQGTADVHLTGEGATITVRLDMNTTDYQANKRLFRVTDTVCVIDNLKIMVVEAEKHETLLSWIAPIISSRVKGVLEEKIVESLRDSIERIEEGMEKIVELAPSLEQVRQGVSLVSHPITQGVPAALGLVTGNPIGTTQG